MCAKDLWIGHILVSEHARFDALDGYTTLQSLDGLMVEIDGEWEKAEQWSFSPRSPPRAEHDLLELCKGKAWIHSVGRLIKGIHS